MSMRRELRRSDLFLVRFWAGDKGDGRAEWHGKVQRTVTGETSYFHDWPELVEVLSVLLSPNGADGAEQPHEDCRRGK